MRIACLTTAAHARPSSPPYLVVAMDFSVHHTFRHNFGIALRVAKVEQRPQHEGV